jgi:soluble lytic murein transglycosylase-like protein
MFQKNTVKNYLHHLMLLMGLVALSIVTLAKQPPQVASTSVAQQSAPGTPVVTTPPSPQQALAKQQQTVANWLAKRYRVANDAAHSFVSAAYLTAKDFKLDPLLILSVMAIESGLNPFAESPVGAQGLMQVMSKIHRDKFEEFGGIEAALDPVANIRVGTQILKEYVTRGGSVEAGLKMYVGAALAETDGGYGNKVLAEYRRLKEVSTGKSVPVVTTAAAKRAVIKVAKPKMGELANEGHVELTPLTKT